MSKRPKLSSRTSKGPFRIVASLLSLTVGVVVFIQPKGVSLRIVLLGALGILLLAMLTDIVFGINANPKLKNTFKWNIAILLIIALIGGGICYVLDWPPEINVVTIPLNSQTNSVPGTADGWTFSYQRGKRIWTHAIRGANSEDSVYTRINDPSMAELPVYAKRTGNGQSLIIEQRIDPDDSPIYPSVECLILGKRPKRYGN